MKLRKWILLFCLGLTGVAGCAQVTPMPVLIAPVPAASATPVLITSTSTQAAPTQARAPNENSTQVSTPAPLTHATIESCPVTLPNGKSPPNEEFGYGNDDNTLFTSLWTNGIVIFAKEGPGFVGADGSLAMKWPWFRYNVVGELTIDGKRLDAPAPKPSLGKAGGDGRTGFLPSALIFPSEGCWQITARAGGAELTFVTLVIQVPWKFIYFNSYPDELVSETYDISQLPEWYQVTEHLKNGGEIKVESTVGQWPSVAYPASEQKTVTVRGRAGTCVQGAFDMQNHWQTNTDAGVMWWTEEDSSYRITYKAVKLDCDTLAKMIYKGE